ncbi:SAP domain [Phytophthora cactorum]|nr:SAP domain [Phytophthora cactorum]
MDSETTGSVVPPTCNDYDSWTVAQLRKECTERKLHRKRTTSKPDQIRHLRDYDAAKRAVQSSIDEENLLDPTKRKTKYCPIRLLNVSVFDHFAERLASSDDAATREQLDVGEVNAKTTFWKEVGVEYRENTDDCNKLYEEAAGNPHFASIDPSIIVKHDTPNLFELWKAINRSYVKANAKFYVSGQNSDDFYDYCDGNWGAVYLRVCTKVKPELAAFVYGGMYADDEVDSMNLGAFRARTPGSKPAKWQDQVIKIINRMADFIVGAPPPATKIAPRVKKKTRTSSLIVSRGCISLLSK